MSFHVPEHRRVRRGEFASTALQGNNGAFLLEAVIPGRKLWVIASDGAGWEHVSVSLLGQNGKTPTWAEMDHVCRVFWDGEDAVMQIHPPRAQHVNNVAGCLHLWRPTGGEMIPLPSMYLVGLPGRTFDGTEKRADLYAEAAAAFEAASALGALPGPVPS